MEWEWDNFHVLITIPSNDSNFLYSLNRATDEELVHAKMYLTEHPFANKTRLASVKREIQRRVKKEAKS